MRKELVWGIALVFVVVDASLVEVPAPAVVYIGKMDVLAVRRRSPVDQAWMLMGV
jgi:hypothetical protein